MMYSRSQYVQDKLAECVEFHKSEIKGFVSRQDTERLLKYCLTLMDSERLSQADRDACKRYLSNDRLLTVAEAARVGVLRRTHNRKAKDGKEDQKSKAD